LLLAFQYKMLPAREQSSLRSIAGAQLWGIVRPDTLHRGGGMAMDDEDRVSGRIHGEQPEVAREGLALRTVHMVLIWLMLSLAQTVLTLCTVVQLAIMALNRGAANPRLAEFGTDLGIWMAKAARFQTGASEVKPWPWTELD